MNTSTQCGSRYEISLKEKDFLALMNVGGFPEVMDANVRELRRSNHPEIAFCEKCYVEQTH